MNVNAFDNLSRNSWFSSTQHRAISVGMHVGRGVALGCLLLAQVNSSVASGNGVTPALAGAPDNIIVKESFVLARPDIVLAGFNRTIDELCPALPRASLAEVQQMYAQTVLTYLSGRSKTVIKEGFFIDGLGRQPCNALGERTQSVQIDKPKQHIDIYKKGNDVTVKITDFSNDESFDLGYAIRLKTYPQKLASWTKQNFLRQEKVFGYDCSYQDIGMEVGCTLLPYPKVIAFNDFLVLKAPPHRHPPGCEKSVDDALAGVSMLNLRGTCLGDMVHTIDRFEMNAAMPAGIFDIPPDARGVQPVVKVIK